MKKIDLSAKNKRSVRKTTIISTVVLGFIILTPHFLMKTEPEMSKISTPVVTSVTNGDVSTDPASAIASTTTEVTESMTTINNDMLPLQKDIISFEEIPWNLPIQLYCDTADQYKISYKVNDITTILGTGYSLYIDCYFEGEDPYDFHPYVVNKDETTFGYVCGVNGSYFTICYVTRTAPPTKDAPLSLKLIIKDNRIS